MEEKYLKKLADSKQLVTLAEEIEDESKRSAAVIMCSGIIKGFKLGLDFSRSSEVSNGV